MDIRPPKRRPSVTAPSSDSTPADSTPEAGAVPPVLPDLSLNEAPTTGGSTAKRKISFIIGGIFALILVCVACVVGVYEYQLSPVNVHDATRTRITIATGSSPSQIAQTLADKKLIRSTKAFDIYLRLTKTRNKLQAGSYSLSPALSTAAIVDHLVSGKVDQFKVTFFTGGTLKAVPGTADEKKTDVVTMLLRAGFSRAEIDAALAKTYNSPLFSGRPVGASLEGYIYGDTYLIDSSTSVEQLLNLAFTSFNKAIVDNDIVAGLQAQGLNLYQGITLASIVQAEMGSHQADMPQVAQVFLKRLSTGMPLGSDVTAYYGADVTGASRSVAVDTPYNTRIHPGLPPGPIGVPSLAALKAVAHPAGGNYLFFLSGDDGKTYFATTDAEHEANKAAYCQKLCAIP